MCDHITIDIPQHILDNISPITISDQCNLQSKDEEHDINSSYFVSIQQNNDIALPSVHSALPINLILTSSKSFTLQVSDIKNVTYNIV